MKSKLLVMLAAVSAASFAMMGQSEAAEGKDKPAAEGKAKPAAKGAAKGGAPGTIEKTVGIAPKGLTWGMTLESIARLYDKVFDDEFLPLFKKVEPGPKLNALEEELKTKKGVLRRSRIDFGNTPTGVDQSALKGEYSYGNGESMARMTLRSGTVRHFFFFNDRLWKIYDEHKLQQGGTLGENFEEATKILTTRFGAAPKKLAQDFDKGQPFAEAQWRDPEKVIRAIDRGNILGMVYIDRKIHDNLAQYRKNKPVDQHAMDKDVATATATPPSDPAKAREEKEKAEKAGKKDEKTAKKGK